MYQLSLSVYYNSLEQSLEIPLGSTGNIVKGMQSLWKILCQEMNNLSVSNVGLVPTHYSVGGISSLPVLPIGDTPLKVTHFICFWLPFIIPAGNRQTDDKLNHTNQFVVIIIIRYPKPLLYLGYVLPVAVCNDITYGKVLA